jgi:hypothetical protein
VTNKNLEALEVYRHQQRTCWPWRSRRSSRRCSGIGPPIEDGFFYDFIVEFLRAGGPEAIEAK